MRNNLSNNRIAIAMALLAMVLIPGLAQADTDVTSIVTGATSVFTAVATLCVSIGVFFVGYRLAKRVK